MSIIYVLMYGKFFVFKYEIYNIRVFLMWFIEIEVNIYSIYVVDSVIKII